MKKMLLVLLVMVACSGQMCGTATTNTGIPNICGRAYFEPTYRIGIDLPAGVGVPQGGETNNSVALKQTWDWATNPASKFVLVVSTPVGSTTLEQVSQDSLTAFQQGNFTVMQSFKVALDDDADAWYFALSPNDKDNISLEMVMTLSQGRLITLSATYSSTLPQDKTDAIGATLRSLCADVE
jgi:hypothetical protein